MNDNPKWKPFLDVIPESLHPLIKPVLADWDKGVNELVQGVHAQYAPYKPLVDNKVDPNRITQALQIADQISQDPVTFAHRLDETFNLNLFQQAVDNGTGDNDDSDWDGVDIVTHPQFRQMASMLENVNKTLEEQAAEREAQAQQSSFEQHLNDLEEQFKDKGVWNKTLITAYMTQGLSGQEAFDQLQKDIAAAVGTTPGNGQQDQGAGNSGDSPPPVMGSTGTAGSGLPDTSVTPSTWSNKDTNAAVAEMLRLAAEQAG